MKSIEIRKRFLSYFEKNKHLVLKSSSLIPFDDPTLLFNNAGMNQFKNVFLGVEKPKSNRVVTAQKCVRAGGKHNDLDNVGFTARHHTFFEMLGNFSFGDYFKKEAISFAWGFLTEELKLPKEKLYVTAFHSDEEAKNIWLNDMKVSKDHFKTFGEADNFWRMGDTGPCGPCSEIFYDLGPEVGDGPEDTLGGEGDRFVEIWNLVFMQFNESKNSDTGEKIQHTLKKPSIDTGMGLERISMVMQSTKSNYETDLFMPLIEKASTLTNTKYNSKKPKSPETSALRVLADHARAVCFLIADGVLPSNEGRGYVLRRILRRAFRFNKKLEASPIFVDLCKEVITLMSPIYSELSERQTTITDYVAEEEIKFLETLEHGERLLNQEVESLRIKNKTELSGDIAFKLYDTFGFPLDLTEVILKEKNITLNHDSFHEALKKAKEKSKSGSSFKTANELPESIKTSIENLKATNFLGYTQKTTDSKILEIHTSLGKVDECETSCFVFFDQTPFYAEGGGQASDTGQVLIDDSNYSVTDVQKVDHLFLHKIEPNKKTTKALKVNSVCTLAVDEKLRLETEKNHSSTHLLHAALIESCGDQVQQAGSSVTFKRLRFDFTHKGPVVEDKLLSIEAKINSEIKKAQPTSSKLMSLDDAKKNEAKALFGEKYGDEVRVLNIGSGFSIELCGGTHVKNTKDIELFKIVSESSVASGVRRIEAVTGDEAKVFSKRLFDEYTKILKYLKLNASTTPVEIFELYQKRKDSLKQLKSLIKSGAKEDKLNFDAEWVDSTAVNGALKIDSSSDTKSSEVDLQLQGSQNYTRLVRLLNLARHTSSSEVLTLFDKLKEEKEKLKIKFNSSDSSSSDENEALKEEINGLSVSLLISKELERQDIGDTCDKLLHSLSDEGLCVVVGKLSDRGAPLAVSKSKGSGLKAGKVLQSITSELGGKGGGRDSFAQGSLERVPTYKDLKAALIKSL